MERNVPIHLLLPAMYDPRRDLTRVLHQAASGDTEAANDLWDLTYEELRGIAGRHLLRERVDHTLSPTALVHEAYLRLVDQTRVEWKDRNHFFAIASRMCCRVLVDHARRRVAAKRGGAAVRIRRGLRSAGGPEGDPIDVWCDRQRLGLEARLRLFLSVCDAVRYAHGALVVHRDLRPGNILVHDGEVKLLGFGNARLLEDREGADATRHVDHRLTPEYAAPEQIRGDPTTTSVDVYALGVILYELLTGERPHPLEGWFAEIERVVSEVEPRLPSTLALQDCGPHASPPDARAEARGLTPRLLRERLRGDLDCIVLRTLGKGPSRRYNSVEALADDIERHLAGRTVRARPDSRWYRVSTFVRRNRAAAILAALAAFGLVATTIFALVANQERDRRQLEPQRAVAASDFVIGLLAELDPDLLQGRTTFTRDELISLGTRNLDALDGQPGLQASVLNTLGQVAFNLGDRQQADDIFRRAHTLLQGEEQEPELAASMMGIGEVLRRELEFGEAERWFASALELRSATIPPGDPRTAESFAALAFALYTQQESRYDEAEAMYEELRNSEVRPPPRLRATVLEGFADLRWGQQRYREAEELYLEAIEARSGAVGRVDAATARIFWGVGHARRHQGRLEEAEASYREALVVHEATHGPHHADVAWGYYNLWGDPPGNGRSPPGGVGLGAEGRGSRTGGRGDPGPVFPLHGPWKGGQRRGLR